MFLCNSGKWDADPGLLNVWVAMLVDFRYG